MRDGAVNGDLRRLSGLCALCVLAAAALGSAVPALLAPVLGAQAAQLLGTAAGLLAPFWALSRLSPAGTPPRKDGGCAPLWSLALLFFGAAGCGVLLSAALFGLLSRFGLAQAEAPLPQGTASVLLYAANAALVSPILEEWAFRGVLLRILRPYGARFAIAASGALFALIHLQPARWPLAFLSGLALAFCAEQTGRLRLPVALHILYNAAGLLLLRRAADLPLLLAAVAAVIALPAARAARPCFPKPDGAAACRAFFLTPAMLLSWACILYLGVTA